MSAVPKENNSASQLTIHDSDFKKVAEYFECNSGIALLVSEKNKSLFRARLSKFLQDFNLNSLNELGKLIDTKKVTEQMKVQLISRLTTHTTHFFRENGHFEYLCEHFKKNAPQFYGKEVRVWIAAASTGQEAYSFLISLGEAGLLNENINWRLLATDIDMESLKKAALGTYFSNDVKDVSKHVLSKYFDKKGQDQYQVKDSLSAKVTFAKLNLNEMPYDFKGKFHLILCRNVLIYFSQEKGETIVKAMENCLHKGGLLVLGHSESRSGKLESLKAVSHSIYERQ